jgi:hypothetical protein
MASARLPPRRLCNAHSLPFRLLPYLTFFAFFPNERPSRKPAQKARLFRIGRPSPYARHPETCPPMLRHSEPRRGAARPARPFSLARAAPPAGFIISAFRRPVPTPGAPAGAARSNGFSENDRQAHHQKRAPGESEKCSKMII